jgi:hypothetical protein
MNQTPLVVKAGVVAGAVLLGTGFVYVRAGGRLPGSSNPHPAPAANVDTTRTILPGSKSAAVVVPSDDSAQVANERSRPPATAAANANTSDKPAATPVLTASERKVIMSSSKSIILSEPSDSPLTRVQPAVRQPSPLDVAPLVPPPPPSPLEALKKPAQRQSVNKRSAPAQQNAAPR